MGLAVHAEGLEARKPLEIGALLGAVIEIADQKGVDLTSLRIVYALATMTEHAARSAR